VKRIRIKDEYGNVIGVYYVDDDAKTKTYQFCETDKMIEAATGKWLFYQEFHRRLETIRLAGELEGFDILGDEDIQDYPIKGATTLKRTYCEMGKFRYVSLA